MSALFYLLLFTLTQPGRSAGIEECRDGGYCENGGTCVLTSELSAGKVCADDEVYHMGYCYSFNSKPMKWNDAARYCNDHDKTLALTESDDDQTFYAGYIQGVLSSVQPQNPRVTGVWTSVRSVLNGSEPAWVSFPGSYVLNKQYWQYGEPNIYPNYENVCVSLQRESMYRNWMSESCDALNYAICKHKAVDKASSQYRLTQCLCQPEYGGIRCEKYTGVSPSQNVSCASKRFEFACMNGGSIQVEYASYGAFEGYVCSDDMPPLTQTCSNPNSFKTINNRCSGLSYCTIRNLTELFPETPCPVLDELFLQYRFSCSEDIQTKCPSGFFYITGRCLSLNDKQKLLSFNAAKEDCRRQGGYLASDIDEPMDAELSRHVVRKSKDEGTYWIDLHVDTNGQATWADGSPVSYRPPGSSLSRPNSCVAYVVSGGMAHWNSLPCDIPANYLCAFPPQEPARKREDAPPPKEEPKVVFEGTKPAPAVGEIFAPAKYCDAEKRKGIQYPKTRACTEARVACPDPETITGEVVRYCNCQTAKWETPDTTNCTHRWVAEMRSAIERGDPAEQISYRMAADLESTLSRQLYGGDITGSVSLSTDVLALARSQFGALDDRNQRQIRATNFTESFGSSGDHLLSPKAVPVWEELATPVRIDHASTLMGALEQSALLLADYTVDQHKRLQYDYWAMEIDVHRPEAYVSRTNEALNSDDDSHDSPIPMDDNTRFIGNIPGAAAPAAAPPTTIQFSGFSQSPIITLPPLDVLRSSSIAATNPQIGVPKLGAFFHPGVKVSQPSLDRSRLRLGYYVFTTFGQLLGQTPDVIVNSHVIGASVDDATRSLTLPEDEPATFTFYHLIKNGVSNPRCVYWNLNNKTWSTDGCRLISTNDDATQCACNHLTSFAILMDVSGQVSRYAGTMSAALDVVSIIGCALSVVCLALSLFVFTFFRSLYNVRNTIHRNLCLSLLIAELVFMIGIDRTENQVGCAVVAVLLHYFFLAAFCWMLLEGYQLYLMLIQVFESDKTRLFLYYKFSYGFPAAVVAISAGVTWHNYGTDEYCWIDTSSSTLWAFIGPIIGVILANVIFLGIALKVVLSVKSRDRNDRERFLGWIKGSATLLCLLGVTWVFGFLTAVRGTGGVVFSWIFTILNCSQGVFIFVLHVLMNSKVRLTVVRWLRSGVCCLPDKSSADNSREYISSRQRIMNMMKANSQSGSSPNTASTDDKEKQLTPTTKTNEWLRHLPMEGETSPLSSPRISSDMASTPDDHISGSSDPRASPMDVHGDPVEKHAPVKRKKFPLGASEHERRSQDVVVVRF
uniref:Latrophilin-like protein 2 n=2 Tax=Haemonchus contortus TaxID=6289 RepID=A0A7I4Y1W5_HAECO